MTFESFLTNNILPIFTNIINWCGVILSSLMNNYVFLIILYVGIIIIIIQVIKEIIGLILGKTLKEKDKGN